MQDKEFDQLFKDRFEDAEIEPSSNLWANISEQLEPRKKRVLPIYWMAAAALAAITVSINLLSPETEKIRLQAPAQFADNTVAADLSSHAPNAKVAVDNKEDKTYKSTALVIAPRLTEADVKKDFASMQPIAPADRQDIKQTETLAAVSEKSDEVVPVNNDVMIASADVQTNSNTDEIAEEGQTERKGIRNVGDLVNYVVDKVDKRDKKFLKFNTDDDDNSSLIGINIGFLKLNSKKHK